MQHYFKLIGQPVYFGYNNGRTIKVETAPCSITFYGRENTEYYQLFSAGDYRFEPIGTERFCNILDDVNAQIQDANNAFQSTIVKP